MTNKNVKRLLRYCLLEYCQELWIDKKILYLENIKSIIHKEKYWLIIFKLFLLIKRNHEENGKKKLLSGRKYKTGYFDLEAVEFLQINNEVTELNEKVRQETQAASPQRVFKWPKLTHMKRCSIYLGIKENQIINTYSEILHTP